MKINPLLSNDITVSDQNDENHNEKYSKELKVLYDEIMDDLQKADPTGTGKISEDELLDFLQKKLPPQRQLNIPLFKRFLQNVDQNIDANIDLNEFCKKYIQAHEELKLNFETLKKGFDKEKNLKNELQEKNEVISSLTKKNNHILNKKDIINENIYINTNKNQKTRNVNNEIDIQKLKLISIDPDDI